MKYKYFLSIILLFASAGLLLGHGVHVEVKQFSPLILVTSGYSAANPLKDASVSVFAPGEEEIFQNGRTDKCGVFSFNHHRNKRSFFHQNSAPELRKLFGSTACCILRTSYIIETFNRP